MTISRELYRYYQNRNISLEKPLTRKLYGKSKSKRNHAVTIGSKDATYTVSFRFSSMLVIRTVDPNFLSWINFTAPLSTADCACGSRIIQ